MPACGAVIPEHRDQAPHSLLAEPRDEAPVLTPSVDKGMLAMACRTPPVRGQDRVHLIDMLTSGSYEPPLPDDGGLRAA